MVTLLFKRDRMKDIKYYSDDYKKAAEYEAVLEGCVLGLPFSLAGGFLFPIVITQHVVLFMNPKKD